jgi:hypothetical protein
MLESKPDSLEADANARLIAAVGTVASELPKGCDPVGTVEALPKMIRALTRARRYFAEQYREGELGALRSLILVDIEEALGGADLIQND